MWVEASYFGYFLKRTFHCYRPIISMLLLGCELFSALCCIRWICFFYVFQNLMCHMMAYREHQAQGYKPVAFWPRFQGGGCYACGGRGITVRWEDSCLVRTWVMSYIFRLCRCGVRITFDDNVIMILIFIMQLLYTKILSHRLKKMIRTIWNVRISTFLYFCVCFSCYYGCITLTITVPFLFSLIPLFPCTRHPFYQLTSRHLTSNPRPCVLLMNASFHTLYISRGHVVYQPGSGAVSPITMARVFVLMCGQTEYHCSPHTVKLVK